MKTHLNPGGVVTLFVQLYESNTEAVKSEIATFFEAFPNGIVFGNTNNGAGYDLGAARPGGTDAGSMSTRSKRSCSGPNTRRSRSRCARSASIRRSICFRRTPGSAARPAAVAEATRRSTAIAICACSTSPVSA